ncbi:MAG: CpaF family protein [Chloroflexi bacterium]|nr:MAG: CpaF family protein [Chloroflexota bacterium]
MTADDLSTLLPRYRERLVGLDGELGPLGDEQRPLAVTVLVESWLSADGVAAGPPRDRLLRLMVDELTGYGPLQEVLTDASITEVMVNGPDAVFVEIDGRLQRTGVRFQDSAQVRAVIERLLLASGRRLDDGAPMVDARLPDGSRLNAVLPPIAVDGPVLTIRRPACRRLDLGSLVESQALSAEMAAFLHAAVLGRCNLLISGGAGTGKTTLLAALCALVPGGERIIVLEDVAELAIDHAHLVRQECRPPRPGGTAEVTLRHLVRNSLRMRPDRLVIGEVRGPEAADMVTAMNTGHAGSMTTLHANGPADALARLDDLLLQAWPAQPAHALRTPVLSALDLLVHCERSSAGDRAVAVVAALDTTADHQPIITPLFRRTVEDGGACFRPCGDVPRRVLERMAGRGVYFPPGLFATAEESR